MTITAEVIRRLERCLPEPRPIPLHEPDLSGNEGRYVQECIDSGWVSSAGAFVDRFERDLADYTGAAGAVACVNGTAALHMAMRVAGVKPGDEVVIPSLTFVTTANAVSMLGAVPHLADIEETSLGLDPERLNDHLAAVAEPTEEGLRNISTGARIAAVVAVHVFGHPAEVGGLARVCERFSVPFIEDATESLGSQVQGRHCGTFGRLGVLSFNGNKIVTTGGGGAIVSNDTAVLDRARHLTTTAKVPHRWAFEHDEVGFNYRLPNLNAALGCAQLERLPSMVERKRALAERYVAEFSDLAEVSVMTEPAYARSNYWLNALLLPASPDLRDSLLEETHQAGILTRPVWTPMHRLPMYSKCPTMDLDVTERIYRRLINIPSSASLAGEPATT